MTFGLNLQDAQLVTVEGSSALQAVQWVQQNGHPYTAIAGTPVLNPYTETYVTNSFSVFGTKFFTPELVAAWNYDSRNKTLFADRGMVIDGVRLLGAAGDEEVAGLADRLPAQGSAEMLHHIGMDLLDLCEGRGQLLAPVLIWMVETTPCSFCRHSALDRLLALGAVRLRALSNCRTDGRV